MIKILENARLQETYLKIIKVIYKKPAVNDTLIGDLEAPPLKSATRQVCPLSPLHFNTVLEILTGAIRQEKELQRMKIEKN